VLQHGSLPLYGDLGRIAQALNYPDQTSRSQAAEKTLAHATTVASVLGQQINWDQAARAFVQAFEDTLDLELQAGEMSAWEQRRTEELVIEKYSHPDWTRKI
jgi:lipoate-protein ligase A